jgi:hypothetical protein
VKSLYIAALKDLLGVQTDESGVNGARFPLDDWNFNNTIENAYKAFEALFNAWENDFENNALTALMGELKTLTKKEYPKNRQLKNLQIKVDVINKLIAIL